MIPTPSLSGPFDRREDGPWWARVVLWFLAHYGLPTLLALSLGVLFVWLSVGDVKAIRLEVVGTKAALKQHNDQMITDAITLRTLQETQIRILQAMCYNAAKSDAGRTACVGGK